MKISMLVLACGLGVICSGLAPVRAEDTDTDARLREALRQRMNEANPPSAAPVEQPRPVTVKQPAPKSVKPVKPAPQPVRPAPVATPVVAPVEVAQPAPTPAPTASATPIVAAADDAQTEQLREALRARMAQEAATPSAPVVVATPTTSGRPVVANKQTVAVVLPEAPPSSLPATKEGRLAQLLQQYKADQITPEQYHLERAKIIAEP